MYRQAKCLDEIFTNHIKHNKKVEKTMFSPKSIILYDSYPAFSVLPFIIICKYPFACLMS